VDLQGMRPVPPLAPGMHQQTVKLIEDEILPSFACSAR
jgi:hypothetical protein